MMNWMTLLAQTGESETMSADEKRTADTPPPTEPDPIAEAQSTFSRALEGDMDAIIELLMPLGGAILIIVATFIVAKIVRRLVTKFCDKADFDETLERFFAKLIYYLVLIIGLTFALSFFGIEVTSLAAILAAAGFAVGMALSGTLSNFANGVMLLIFRPFDVGDVISAAGITAKVNAIELFTTTLDTPDNKRIIVPNSAIYGGVIENITHHDERRADVFVGVDYSANMDKTREVLTKAAESLSDLNVKGEGRGFQVFMIDLGDSSVNWTVRFWTTGDDFWTAKEKLTHAVKQYLDEAGIGIPFPQMDVHLDKVGD